MSVQQYNNNITIKDHICKMTVYFPDNKKHTKKKK